MSNKPNTVNTEEVIEALIKTAEDNGKTITKKLAKEIVGYFLEACTESLINTGKVQIPGYFTLSVRYLEAKKGINPATKEAIDIPEGVSVSMKPGSKIKAAVKEKVDPTEFKKKLEQ